MSIQTLASHNTRSLSSDSVAQASGAAAPSAQWSAAQISYMRWLAAPDFDREPATEADLARELGCSGMTLRLWRMRPAFRREVERLAASFQRSDLAELLTSLERKASMGSAKHSRMYHELLDLAKTNTQQPAGTVVLVGVKLGDS
jgi:hypothetical protein